MSKDDIKSNMRKDKDPRIYERWVCINCSIEGKTVPEIALILYREEKTIREWIGAFNREGPVGIRSESPTGKKKG